MPEVNERDDPEGSYRRGYHQGARDAVEAAQRLTGNRSALSELWEWATVTLLAWRLNSRPDARTALPPVPPRSNDVAAADTRVTDLPEPNRELANACPWRRQNSRPRRA